MKVVTMRGRVLDMAALMARHPHAVAVGNASMNTRGDIIGAGGKVLKKREQIAMEYHASNPNAVKSVGIRALAREMFTSPAEAIAQAQVLAQRPPPAEPAEAPVLAGRRRKLLDPGEAPDAGL